MKKIIYFLFLASFMQNILSASFSKTVDNMQKIFQEHLENTEKEIATLEVGMPFFYDFPYLSAYRKSCEYKNLDWLASRAKRRDSFLLFAQKLHADLMKVKECFDRKVYDIQGRDVSDEEKIKKIEVIMKEIYRKFPYIKPMSPEKKILSCCMLVWSLGYLIFSSIKNYKQYKKDLKAPNFL